jgi:hypothetical protein
VRSIKPSCPPWYKAGAGPNPPGLGASNRGIGPGVVSYALIKLVAGRFADAKPAMLVLALIFPLSSRWGRA